MSDWPALPYEEWRDTVATLHLYGQVIGKLRVVLSPYEAEWANVALYVTPRGLSTSTVPYQDRSFDAEFDFWDHEVIFRSSDGARASVALRAQSVADFFAEVMECLENLRMPVAINELPQEMANPVAFSKDRVHHHYDPASAHRFWQVLRLVDAVMKQHRAGFWGKTSPVHFFWGTNDLANTRFSGRRAAPPEGSGLIMRYAEDAEQISAGFWPGDERTPFPAFYAYGYPRPDGCERALCRPEAASWVEQAGLFVLPYEAVRTSGDPSGTLLAFLESTYEACAGLMGWSGDLLVKDRPPSRSTPQPADRPGAAGSGPSAASTVNAQIESASAQSASTRSTNEPRR